MKKPITLFLIATITLVAKGQKETNYIFFYKPYTDSIETNLYKTISTKFDYKTQYNNVKNADVNNDFINAIKHNDYRFIAISSNAYLFPGMDGYTKQKSEGKSFGILKMYEPYLKKYKFKVVKGTSDLIVADAPSLQGVAYDYASRYNQMLLIYLEKQGL